ncbi:Purine nucleoside phosphorylase [Aphelenchoides besseyi]|nr:Purine nucleoside phosphorylase [Aphelenchoides besseyi]
MVKQVEANGVLCTLAAAKAEAEMLDHGEVTRTFNPKSYDDVYDLAQTIRRIANLKFEPKVGIICGSGLGDLAEMVENATIIPYSRIPGFPNTHVVGHKGNLVFGQLQGKSVVCLQGRFHPYEHNMDLALCTTPVRIMHLLGIETLIVSNAAGGINPDFAFGDLMLLKDHIFMPGLCGFGPLVGMNDPRFGPRFVSVHDAYDVNLRKMALKIAKEQKIKLHEGVYCMSAGPQYETPSEVKLYKVVGVDALGMSTAHEVTVARQLSIRVLGFSLITNIANTDVDNSVEVSHAEVLSAAKQASDRACRFVAQVVSEL